MIETCQINCQRVQVTNTYPKYVILSSDNLNSSRNFKIQHIE